MDPVLRSSRSYSTTRHLVVVHLGNASEVIGADRIAVLSTRPLLKQVLDHLTREDITDAQRQRAEAFAVDLVEPAPGLVFGLPLPTTPWLRRIADVFTSPSDTRTVEEWAAAAKVSVPGCCPEDSRQRPG